MSPATALLAGYVASAGFGETPGPAVRLIHERTWLRVEAGVEIVPKIESGAGWVGKLDLDVGRTFFLGAGYSHRDGGAWTKEAVWGRLGIRAGALRLVTRHDFTTSNEVSIIEASVRASWGNLELRPSLGVGSFKDGGGRRRSGLVVEVAAGVGW